MCAKLERSLCRNRFLGQNFTVCNKDGKERSQEPFMDGLCYTPFSLPNIY